MSWPELRKAEMDGMPHHELARTTEADLEWTIKDGHNSKGSSDVSDRTRESAWKYQGN